jgi:diaminohydroxyphosphoribosylaminopyrimidine deaminase/5-amino-6-(5-phosphoribosylamino)uracil reductase
MQDPNPQVAGSGLKRLCDAGVDVSVGVLQEEAEALNPGFIKRMKTGLPRVRCKLAMSLDGRTAMANGESQWITGPLARADVQQLRAESCAVLTGVGSILIDDSKLTVRDLALAPEYVVPNKQPLRVVLDSRLCTPCDAAVIGDDHRCLILYSNKDVCNAEELRQHGARVVRVTGQSNSVDLESAMRYLAEKEQCNDVLLEAGATLSGAMMAAGLIDELHLYVAPILMGSEARPLMALPLMHMADKYALEIVDIRQVGEDWRIVAKPKERECLPE